MSTCIHSVRIKGIDPTIMHNNRLANPFDPLTKEFKRFTGKRKKSEEDFRQISRLEWLAGLYLDSQGRIGWPGANIHAMLIAAAKRAKMGPAAKAFVACGGVWPLECDGLDPTGPAELEKLWNDGDRQFVLCCPAKNQKSTIMRTRPWFHDWELAFEIRIDPDQIDASIVRDWLVDAGSYIGLSDWRPTYGKFSVLEFEERNG